MVRRLKFFLIVFALMLLFPLRISAAGARIGTHLAQGDLSSQIRVIDFIKSLKPSSGYPITVMVNLGGQDLAALANHINGAGFAVNLRILGIGVGTTTEEIFQLAEALNATTWDTVGKPVVVFGNELNNLEVEWGGAFTTLGAAANKYTALWPALAGLLNLSQYDLAAAPLDPYHPNPAAEFINTAGSAYTQANTFVANLYDGVGSGLDGLSTFPGFAVNKSRKVLTEFGINPNTKDVLAHKNFYAAYESGAKSLPGGFESATALLPNLCDKNPTSANRWYYYIVGNIYNANLKELDDTCREADSRNTFIYPAPDDVFRNAPGDINAKISAFAEGISKYMMTCSPLNNFIPKLDPSNPQVPVVLANNKKVVVDLVSFCAQPGADKNPNCVFDPVNETITINADNATLPLVRSGATGRTGSMEGFFTSDLSDPEALAKDPRLAAPAQKLLPREETCKQNVKFLRAVDLACIKLPPEEQGKINPKQVSLIEQLLAKFKTSKQECALNETLNGKKLMDWFVSVQTQPGVAVGSEEAYCNSSAFTAPVGDDQTALADALMKVQPITKKAYKKAYFIIYMFSKDELTTKNIITRIFHPYNQTYLRNMFKVVPVLIPANFGADITDGDVTKADGTPIVGTTFDGAYKRTLSALMPLEAQAKVQDQLVKDRDDVKAKMTEFGGNTVKDDGMIYLPYCDPASGVSLGTSGLDPDEAKLNCWFADRINAGLNLHEFVHPQEKATCAFYNDKVGGESADTLKEPVKPLFTSVLSSISELFSGKAPGQSVDINGAINLNKMDQLPEEEAKLRIFLLIPQSEYGLIKYTEKYMYQAMLGKETTDKVYSAVKAGEELDLNGFLRADGVEISMDGGNTKVFGAPAANSSPSPGASPGPASKEVRAFFHANGPDANPLVYGGWLARAIHSITAEVIAPVEAKMYEGVYAGKKALEKYWMGGTNTRTTMTACAEYRAQKTVVSDIADVQTRVCQTARDHNIPPQVLWGIFKIEGGTARDQAYSGGGSVSCSVNSFGAVGPMQQLVNSCRKELNLSEAGDANIQGQNVCDLQTSLDIAAQQLENRANSANREFLDPDGSVNWYWVAGFYNLGAKVLPGREYHTEQCAGAPAVDGCGGLNYCQCAVDRFAITCNQ